MLKLLQQRVIKFLFGGGVAAAFNLLLIFVLIEWFGFTTPLLRNVANIIAIELSLILSFFIYRIWVWPGGVWRFSAVLFKQLPLYHLSAGMAVLLRVLIVFPLLDRLGVDYGINTLIGILLSAIVNYLISDRLVFKNREHELSLSEGSESSHHPHRPNQITQFASASTPIKLFSVVIFVCNEEGSFE